MMTKKVLLSILIFVCSIGSAEVVLRTLGYSPYKLPPFEFSATPSWCFGKDSLGLVLKPGKFSVNNNGVKYVATHTENGRRVTKLSKLETDSSKKVFVFGCSYTYGQGVDDAFTYPLLLQSERPDLDILNFAVPGYGSVQAFLKLRKELSDGNLPDAVILNYASFHEERDRLSLSYQYKLFLGYQLLNPNIEKMIYPKVELIGDSFEVSFVDVLQSYKPMPFRSYSAILNLVESTLVRNDSQTITSLNVSKAMVKQINHLCKSYGIRFLVADVDFGQGSTPMMNFCERHGIQFLEISPVNFSSEYRVSEFDQHPNRLAHKVYAEKVNDYLTNL